MPYLIMKRSDIPAGTLQVLDLFPNESQRNLIYDTPGQTKYVNPVQNDTVALQTVGGVISFVGSANGLAAWFATNVNDGSGAAATGGDVTIAAGNAADGDTVAVDASSVGGPVITYTWRAAPTLPNELLIGASATASGATLEGAIDTDFAGFLDATNAAGVVTVDVVPEGTAGDSVTLVVAGANLSSTNPSGGVDANALSAADCNDNAQDVLDLLNFGDLSAAAGALDLATVNGALTAGTLTADQLTEVLEILAGRPYFVPAGVVIEEASAFGVVPAIGAAGGPVLGPQRMTFDTSSLLLSANTGKLAGFTAASFEYSGVGGAQGEAIVIYNDDGTLY